MKQLKQLILSLLLFATAIPATAIDFEVDGIGYNKTSETTVEVTTSSLNYTGNVVIPSTVTYNNTTYSVTTIGNAAFSGCSSLTSVTIGNGVTTIGKWAFKNCRSLTSVTIPNSVTAIYMEAFIHCSSLTSVTIGSGVTTFGDGMFEGCENISEVYAMMKEPCSFLASSTFSVYGLATLYVPIGCKEKYENKNYWNEFRKIVETDFSGVTTAKERDASEMVIETYDLQGRKTKPQRGISIERRADGTARKVLVK